MKSLVPVLALPLLLAACNVDTKTPVDGDEKVAMKADASGNVSFDMPFAKGQLKLPAGMMNEGDVDIDGVKMMPGSKMSGFSMNAGEGKQDTVNLTFTAPRPPAEVQRYFADEFGKQGARATAGGDTLQGTTKDGTAFTMRFAAAGTGTNGTIELLSKP